MANLAETGVENNPERLSARLQGDSKSSNKVQRAIFEVLRQSTDAEIDAVETARLVARVRVLRFSDANEGDFINLCAEIVRGSRLEESAKLWASSGAVGIRKPGNGWLLRPAKTDPSAPAGFRSSGSSGFASRRE
jgi:hypothetical protein